MRVLVCGGRDFNEKEVVYKLLNKIDAETPIASIIHGCAKGADSLAGEWARDYGKFEWKFPADWEKHGKAAGPIRNVEMLHATTPDLVVAFPGGRGTQHMVDLARKHGYNVGEVFEHDLSTHLDS